MGYTSVVVGTDGSTTAERAVRTAGEVAAADGARLVVVAAFAPTDDDARAGGVAARLTDREEARRTAERAAVVAREAGAGDVAALPAEGAAADVLLAVAEDRGADLVVVGSRGMSGPSRFELGAVANTVSHHAGCDVLIVHTA